MSISGGRVCCLMLLVLVVAMMAVSLAAPFWATVRVPVTSKGGGEVTVGMILACGQSPGDFLGTDGHTCHVIKMDREFGWFEKCRWLIASGTAFLILLGLVAMFNMCYGSETLARYLGGLSVVAALLAVTGAGMFTSDYDKSVALVLSHVPAASGLTASLTLSQYTLEWACYLEMGACSLVMLLGLALVVLPKTRDREIKPL